MSEEVKKPDDKESDSAYKGKGFSKDILFKWYKQYSV